MKRSSRLEMQMVAHKVLIPIRVLLSIMALLLTVACPSALSRPAAQQTALSNHPKTVGDYFLLLPNQYVGGLVTQSARRAVLAAGGTICDVKHDYLLTTADGARQRLNVVLFRHAGQVTVAVLNGGYDAPEPSLVFLRRDGGHWKNVTKHVLPADAVPEPEDHERLTYQLPRYGTTIHVLSSVGTKDCDLVWQGGRFIQRSAR